MCHTPGQFVFLTIAQNQKSAGYALIAKSDRFFQGANREERCAVVKCSTGNCQGTVPITVVLDYRQYLQVTRFILVNQLEISLELGRLEVLARQAVLRLSRFVSQSSTQYSPRRRRQSGTRK